MKLFLSGKSSKPASVSSAALAAEPQPAPVNKYATGFVF